MSGAPSHQPESHQVILRGACLDDAEALTRLLEGDTELAQQTASIPIPFTIEDARAYLSTADPSKVFAIIVRGELAGITGMKGEGEAIEIGYCLGRTYWGRGYATEAVRLLVAEARERGIESLFADVFPDNPASIRVLEKNGFVRGGVIERDLPLRGGIRQLVRFYLRGGPGPGNAIPK